MCQTVHFHLTQEDRTLLMAVSFSCSTYTQQLNAEVYLVGVLTFPTSLVTPQGNGSCSGKGNGNFEQNNTQHREDCDGGHTGNCGMHSSSGRVD